MQYKHRNPYGHAKTLISTEFQGISPFTRMRVLCALKTLFKEIVFSMGERIKILIVLMKIT